MANEITINLSSYKTRRRGLFKDDVDHIDAIEVASGTQESFLTIVVLVFVDDELEIHIIPACKCSSSFPDILFRVVANAHRKQLHDFASEVLISRTLHIHTRIQEGQHCGILGDGYKQIAKIPGSVFVKQLELAQRFSVIAHLRFINSEMPMTFLFEHTKLCSNC